MTTVATALPVSDFAQFAIAATDRPTWRPGIQVFLATLAQCTNSQNIERVSLDARGKILEANESINTANRVCTAHRKAIVEWQKTITLEVWNSTEASPTQIKQGWAIDGRVHLALKFLTLGKEIHAQRNAVTAVKTETQRTARVGFDPFAAITAAEAALKSATPADIAAGLILLTGRRPIEIWRRQGFKITGRHTIEFSGQAKTKKGAGKGQGFTIYCLTDSSRIVDGFAKLNRAKDVVELDSDTNEGVDSRRNSGLNRAIARIFGAIIAPPAGEMALSAKNLRAAYTVAAATLFKPPTESISHFAQSVLGHQQIDQTLNYEDYYASDNKGNELVTGQWRDRILEAAPVPASQKKSSMTADQQLIEEIRAIPGETQAERLRAAIDAYKTQGRLQRQLAMAQREIARLRAKYEPQSEPQSEPKQPTTDKWATMPSAELRGHQGPGSAAEKLARAMAAIVAYNSERATAERYRLSAANLRKVSGCRHNSVVAWIAERATEIDAYNAANNLASPMADRGKPDIEGLIGW